MEIGLKKYFQAVLLLLRLGSMERRTFFIVLAPKYNYDYSLLHYHHCISICMYDKNHLIS